MTGDGFSRSGMRRALGAALVLAGVGAPATVLPPEATAQVPPTRTDEQARERAEARLAEVLVHLDTVRVRLGDGPLRALQAMSVQRGIGIGIADDDDRPGAVRVLSVTPRSGADEGGLRVGDLVVAVDGTRLDAAGDETPTEALIREVRLREAGDTVRIALIRDGREEVRTVEVRPLADVRIRATGLRPGQGPGQAPVVELLRGSLADAVEGPRRLALAIGTPGLHATNLNEGLSGYFGRGDGALLLEVGDRAPEGLRAGDVVIGIDGREVTEAADLRRILASYRAGEQLTFRIWREGREIEVASEAR
jgi:S1-C subfamily serine protease